MKMIFAVAVVGIFMFCSGVSLASTADKGVLQVAAGSTVYACGCGETCGCGTIGRSKGTCQCGHDLIKVTVAKVENNSAVFIHDGKTHSIPLTGKYRCACDASKGCCEIISQKQVTCGCGKEMVPVK
jgi:hypothetical protein